MMHSSQTILCNYNKTEAGAALVTALIVLLLLTMIGISSISGTSGELKRSNNAQERFRTTYILQSVSEYVGIDIMRNPDHPDYDKGIPKQLVDNLKAIGDPITIPAATVPGVQTATVVVAFKEFIAYASLPGVREEATYISKGTGDENPPVYEVFIDLKTDANKYTKGRSGTVYVPPTGVD